MKILLIYEHHPRVLGHFVKQAFKQLGHEVVSVGAVNPNEPLGCHGRMPDLRLDWCALNAVDASQLRVNPSDFDLRILIDHGEMTTVWNLPHPWVHWSFEGPNLGWSNTQYKYAGILTQVGDVDNVSWLPGGFDAEEHDPRPIPQWREYDLVQAGAVHASRGITWNYVTANAKDLNCVFGQFWGPLYAQIYRHGLATWVDTGVDFIKLRVFEAMALGCVVISPRNYAMLSLFNEDEHFIGYEPIIGPKGEPMPEPSFLIDTARRLRRDGDGGMAERAQRLVWTRDCWQHRAATILRDVFGEG